jgi:protein-S-isoprenylcysteine O-methyltransferase Ste14
VSAFLYRYRGEIVVLWGLAQLTWILPSHRWTHSVVSLLAGLALRAWARRHIGAHSRGRILSCPERVAGGPYRWIPHPLYLANLLVLAGLASCVLGPAPLRLALALSGPVLLYAVLARAERRLLDREVPPARTTPVDAASGKWRSEWASFLPPVLLWIWAAW